MFIDSIRLQNFRTFRETEISFVHPDQDFKKLGLPKPRLPNINLLLGNNGWGKTTLLKAIALAAFGPARPLERYADAGYFVRREPGSTQRGVSDTALVEASFTVHPQDKVSAEITHLESRIEVKRKGDSEQFNWGKPNTDNWDPIF
ncbi:MAG: ATP-binding protein, partial [Candidatus Methylumidiphilus sp.]